MKDFFLAVKQPEICVGLIHLQIYKDKFISTTRLKHYPDLPIFACHYIHLPFISLFKPELGLNSLYPCWGAILLRVVQTTAVFCQSKIFSQNLKK